ncbi:MAG: glycosyltransferase family 4 protein [Chloroflexi bacterium]|nr:glycosyltransferase family 4 protein [Chloroflexota bacterium]
MRILLALTYYRPHISGLTIYGQRLAHALAARGHQVTVLTSHYAKELPYEETVDGVRIIRVPVLFRISKGVIMPGFPLTAWKLINSSDIVSVHLPQLEGGLLAFMCRFLARKKAVLTYHCDLRLPPGWFNRLIDRVVYLDNRLAASWAHQIVAYTQDYAIHSPLLSQFQDKIRVIYPPVCLDPPTQKGLQELRERMGLDGKRVIGFAARFAAEKGVDHLLHALPQILTEIPDVKVVFAGEYRNVIGENVYERLEPLIKQYQEHLVFLGVLPQSQMANFFSLCDVLTVPSVNPTESFGLVQVEAMLCGTPVVASDLPGVREPVRVTGMGEIVPVGDEQALAAALTRVLKGKHSYVKSRELIKAIFDIETTVAEYERLFHELAFGGTIATGSR